MGDFVIEGACGDGHKRQAVLHGYTREEAELVAGILDGTSRAYLSPPGPDSPIGRCTACGKPFVNTVRAAGNGD